MNSVEIEIFTSAEVKLKITAPIYDERWLWVCIRTRNKAMIIQDNVSLTL